MDEVTGSLRPEECRARQEGHGTRCADRALKTGRRSSGLEITPLSVTVFVAHYVRDAGQALVSLPFLHLKGLLLSLAPIIFLEGHANGQSTNADPPHRSSSSSSACGFCYGTGKSTSYATCPECNGDGYYRHWFFGFRGSLDHGRTCKICHGWARERHGAPFGKVAVFSSTEPCSYCGGTGGTRVS